MSTNTTYKHSLLLVDDDRLILVTLAEYLSKSGYNVTTAESADDAEAILSSGDRPDLAILDVYMPGRSGLELAERLRSFDYIPFMLLTAYNDQKLVEQAAISGALGYLVKPVVMSQLVPTIEAALARATELRNFRSSEYRLKNALASEREVSIAIGITMVKYQIARKAAFDLLRKTARSQRCKITELAVDVINGHVVTNIEG